MTDTLELHEALDKLKEKTQKERREQVESPEHKKAFIENSFRYEDTEKPPEMKPIGLPLSTDQVLKHTVYSHISPLECEYPTEHAEMIRFHKIQDMKMQLATGLCEHIKVVERGGFIYLQILTVKNIGQTSFEFDHVGKKIEDLENIIKEKDKEIANLDRLISDILTRSF